MTLKSPPAQLQVVDTLPCLTSVSHLHPPSYTASNSDMDFLTVEDRAVHNQQEAQDQAYYRTLFKNHFGIQFPILLGFILYNSIWVVISELHPEPASQFVAEYYKTLPWSGIANSSAGLVFIWNSTRGTWQFRNTTSHKLTTCIFGWIIIFLAPFFLAGTRLVGAQ